MIEVIIEGIAGFIGGYFSQLAQNRKISITKLFFYSLFLMLAIAMVFSWTSKNFSTSYILFAICFSFAIASLIALLVYLSINRHAKDKRKGV